MNGKMILAAALVSLMTSPALAGSLPEDVPVTYGSPELDAASVTAPAQTAAPQEGMPELDESAVPEGTQSQPESFTVDLGGGGAVRPGDKPKTNSFTIQTVSDIKFPSPGEPANIDATNPEGSTVISQYTLRVSVAELERQIGRNGYTEAQYKELSAQQGFDPEQSFIVLAETKGIAPGAMVQQMALGALPDGTTLGAGDYAADMVVTAYDAETHKKSMVGSVVKVKFHILSDEVTVVFDENGLGTLQAFNPATSGGEVKFAVMISQKAITDGCGEAHRTEAELAAQAANAAFDPEYEFLTLFESEPVAAGAHLETAAQLSRLPDGANLPQGQYTAWLARYNYDESLGLWQLLDAKTQLNLVIGQLPEVPADTP